MPASKIQDHQEIERWIEEGRTYRWMAEEYERKYHISVKPTMFSTYRARHGLPRRIARDDDLIPWLIKVEHRWEYPLAMLRVEARRRGGFPLREDDAKELVSFKARLRRDGLVVHYDPETEQGWWLVPRREGIDDDLIRTPPRKTTERRNADNG